MILEFEIDGQVLKRTDSHIVVNKNKNVYKCQFTFEQGSEWVGLNKFAIFKDGWGNSTTVHLGKNDNIVTCCLPNRVLGGSFFEVSIYAGNLLTTNNVSFILVESGYTHDTEPPFLEEDYKDIFVEIFENFEDSISSIVYNNHSLEIHNSKGLITSVHLPFLTSEEVRLLVNPVIEMYVDGIGTATQTESGLLSREDKIKLDGIEVGATKNIVDSSLILDSDNAVSNRAVVTALNGKEDTYDIIDRLDTVIVNLIENGE